MMLFLGATVFGTLLGASGVFPGDRTQVQVYEDDLTGCQYLLGSRGGAVPRLDVTGGQVGCRKPRDVTVGGLPGA